MKIKLTNHNLKNEIMEYIVNILKKEFNINLNSDIYANENFFSYKINLSERDMVYLLFLSEKHYKINISENAIDSQTFFTLNGFIDCIIKYIIKLKQ